MLGHPSAVIAGRVGGGGGKGRGRGRCSGGGYLGGVWFREPSRLLLCLRLFDPSILLGGGGASFLGGAGAGRSGHLVWVWVAWLIMS